MIQLNNDVENFAVVNTDKGQVQFVNEQDIVEGQLWCNNCRYNDNCEEVLEHCVNFILDNKVHHPKSVEL